MSAPSAHGASPGKSAGAMPTHLSNLPDRPMSRLLQVTEPFLPSIDSYHELLEGVWQRRHLTNMGPLATELERRLREYLELPSPVHCVANGGLGLQILIKALGIRGRVITTPFSYIATAACPAWEGCPVVFADIEPNTLTIDPAAVEAAITPECEAIIATHVFGNPCNIEALESIASRHGLALIFDAAHAFGVTYQGKSVLSYGDASMVSTHATKLFHTVEGGFVTARDPGVMARVEWMRRFGHKGYDAFHGIGINAKLSELHAAMGLAMLPHLPDILNTRRQIVAAYERCTALLDHIRPGVTVRPDTVWNHSYYPVIFESEELLLSCVDRMKFENISPRRYFHPCLNQALEIGNPDDCPVSLDISRRILCLPLSHAMDESDVARVTAILSVP